MESVLYPANNEVLKVTKEKSVCGCYRESGSKWTYTILSLINMLGSQAETGWSTFIAVPYCNQYQ